MNVSVIITTHNRSAALARTLETLAGMSVPEGWTVELIVVDNASTDQTPAVVQNATCQRISVRYLHEPRKGKGFALNTGIAAAKGDILLFTDDDVIPPCDWIERMSQPLVNNKCDAVAGRIELAKNLMRPWLTPIYARWLAATDGWTGDVEMIGANMGFRRSVLDRVPAFDPALAPGAIGFGEDTLFSLQVCEAGLRLKFVDEATVVHQPDESRLWRSTWLKMAQAHGRKNAYVCYHWKHERINTPRLKWLWLWTKLFLRRIVQPPPPLHAEGCPWWEMSYIADMAMCKQYRFECKHRRNYTKKGLVRLIENKASNCRRER
jgi:glycosyltransferase involved in cell wall biosynthesis